MTDAEIIKNLGGSTALAKRLGLEMPNGARRVHNWKTRGIPAEMRLNFPHVFKLAKPTKRPEPADHRATQSPAQAAPTEPQTAQGVANV